MTAVQPKPNGTEVVQWNPWPEIFPLNTRFGQLLDSVWHAAAHPGEFAPGGELEETDDSFVLELDLPGIEKKNISIDVTGRRISVTGAREERERTGVLRHTSRTTGSFAYEVSLPTEVDEQRVSASLSDGVLKVVMPKANGAKTTRIRIS